MLSTRLLPGGAPILRWAVIRRLPVYVHGRSYASAGCQILRHATRPSTFDATQFCDVSYDPAQVGIQTWAWEFGDGGTAADLCPTHRYSADGEYTAKLTITTFDGRTASTSQAIPVQTPRRGDHRTTGAGE